MKLRYCPACTVVFFRSPDMSHYCTTCRTVRKDDPIELEDLPADAFRGDDDGDQPTSENLG